MKRIIYITISAILLISSLTSCSAIKEHNGSSFNTLSVKAKEQSKDGTVTYPLHFISRESDDTDTTIIQNINLIIIDSNGKIVGTTKTGKDGVADITVTVPIDKRYDSQIGTATVIAYNNDKYRRTVMYEVPVFGGMSNQNIIMHAKSGWRDDEVNVLYGNIFHMVPMTLADKYVSWNKQ
ncbi:hypothetical protein [Clostridium sp.]|uniref:hypothetical protein n=1 Tax=Clostridium sp. TaxID=1506 RepID=UPI003D6C9297